MDAANQPEQFSNEWYRRRLNRIEHNLDRQDNDLSDQFKAVRELIARVEQSEAERKEFIANASAKIGELQHTLEELMSLIGDSTKSAELKQRISDLRKNGNAA